MRYWPDSQRVAGTSKAEVLVILSAHQWKHWKLCTRLHCNTGAQDSGTRLWHMTLYGSGELQQRSLRVVRLFDNFKAG